ncbi:zinc-binding dehydrogenase [Streptomyces coerulescens]|uniref:Zinc-binding dehydrogenase n=1 Tax=Streptomyces coerulescens TaxID=29304 RepID=A0ABW0CX81_STRCD
MSTTTQTLQGHAWVVEEFGAPDAMRWTKATTPAPPAGHARLRVVAAGVGFTDLMARQGEYLLQRRTPFTPGYELVAEVVDQGRPDGGPAVPPVGTLVAVALAGMAAYTEHLNLPAWQLVPLPQGLDPVTAAAVPLDYLTALSLLDTHGRVRRGDTVLIQGASGGVGQAVAQLGRLAGLRMYGTASASGAARLASQGVTHIDYRSQDFESVVREAEPHGIQSVFDHIGGANLRKGYRLLAPGGTLVSYAFTGRPGRMMRDTVLGAARVKAMNLRPGRRAALCMVPRELKSDHSWYRTALARVLTMVRDGELAPTVAAVRPLREAADVHRALERGEFSGKVVLTSGR